MFSLFTRSPSQSATSDSRSFPLQFTSTPDLRYVTWLGKKNLRADNRLTPWGKALRGLCSSLVCQKSDDEWLRDRGIVWGLKPETAQPRPTIFVISAKPDQLGDLPFLSQYANVIKLHPFDVFSALEGLWPEAIWITDDEISQKLFCPKAVDRIRRYTFCMKGNLILVGVPSGNTVSHPKEFLSKHLSHPPGLFRWEAPSYVDYPEPPPNVREAFVVRSTKMISPSEWGDQGGLQLVIADTGVYAHVSKSHGDINEDDIMAFYYNMTNPPRWYGEFAAFPHILTWRRSLHEDDAKPNQCWFGWIRCTSALEPGVTRIGAIERLVWRHVIDNGDDSSAYFPPKNEKSSSDPLPEKQGLSFFEPLPDLNSPTPSDNGADDDANYEIVTHEEAASVDPFAEWVVVNHTNAVRLQNGGAAMDIQYGSPTLRLNLGS